MSKTKMTKHHLILHVISKGQINHKKVLSESSSNEEKHFSKELTKKTPSKHINITFILIIIYYNLTVPQYSISFLLKM